MQPFIPYNIFRFGLILQYNSDKFMHLSMNMIEV